MRFVVLNDRGVYIFRTDHFQSIPLVTFHPLNVTKEDTTSLEFLKKTNPYQILLSLPDRTVVYEYIC